MALISPGVDISIIDESQYTSAGQNTVPYILLATAQDKLTPAGTGVAEGTTTAQAGNVYLITSQRDLVNTFGNPTFYKASSGTALHGYELNEFGLMAAYSVLGVTNRAYIQRVDIDLAALDASLTRPLGNPNDGSFWFDLTNTSFGMFTWSSVTNSFTLQDIMVVNDATQLDVNGVPLSSIGQIGSYAVVTTNANNPIYYKNSLNAWVLVGADTWKASVPTVIGTVSSPTIVVGDNFVLNGTTVTATGTTVSSLASDIVNAAISGITASVIDNKLAIYIQSGANSDISSIDVTLTIAAGTTGTLLTEVGLTAGSYAGPIVNFASSVSIPRWRSTDTTPRPTGSIWFKTSYVNSGANFVVKEYSSSTETWSQVTTTLYANDWSANAALDPTGGGINIAAGTVYVEYDVNANSTGTFKLFKRTAGTTSVTGATSAPTFTAGDAFTVSVSTANSTSLTAPVTVTLTGTTAASFVSDFSAANIPGVTATLTTNNNIVLTHTLGGVIILQDTVNTPLATAGFSDALPNVRLTHTNELELSNWNLLVYVADTIAPGQDPLNGTRWYYSDATAVDIMIHDNGAWKGYLNVTNDIHGYDLSATNPTGPLISATAPTTHTDGTALVYGDLWVDTSDLENYPLLYRWESVNTIDQWVLIDNTDQTTSNGVLFADARWATNGTTDPAQADMPTITSLLTSDYLDIDAPNAAFYPDGMLLWNTRRSGYNVKEFRVNYFNSTTFSSSIIPTETNAWVSVSGLKDDGSAYFGRLAQRSIIVQALKSAIDTNSEIREEQRLFNLISCPGYPELIPNMVALNNERANTAFVVGDTPLRLANNGTDIANWATNNGGLGLYSGDGLSTADEYMGVFYPSGRTTDLDGTEIVVPPSHMILRTIIHSDEQSYQWMAPAGVRRGVIDNVDAIGYIDAQTGEFMAMSTSQGLRDVLYTNYVNPITFIPSVGNVNYGNLTTKPGTSLDRISDSRLASYLRLALDNIGKQFIFEPNDKITRDEFKGQVDRLLNDLMSKRAIVDYVSVCDTTNNTSTRIDRNELWLDLAIIPVKDAEFIYIPVRIKSSGSLTTP